MRGGGRVVPAVLAGAVVSLAVEVLVLIAVVRLVGVAATLLLVLVTAAVGALVLRREGVRGWRRWQAAVAGGRPSGLAATDGLLGVLAGVLLVVPGVVTDVLGLALLVPPVRSVAAGLVSRVVARRLSSAAAGDLFGARRVRQRRGPAGGAGAVVEGEVLDGPPQ